MITLLINLNLIANYLYMPTVSTCFTFPLEIVYHKTKFDHGALLECLLPPLQDPKARFILPANSNAMQI